MIPAKRDSAKQDGGVASIFFMAASQRRSVSSLIKVGLMLSSAALPVLESQILDFLN
jgi:hypothetical protein